MKSVFIIWYSMCRLSFSVSRLLHTPIKTNRIHIIKVMTTTLAATLVAVLVVVRCQIITLEIHTQSKRNCFVRKCFSRWSTETQWRMSETKRRREEEKNTNSARLFQVSGFSAFLFRIVFILFTYLCYNKTRIESLPIRMLYIELLNICGVYRRTVFFLFDKKCFHMKCADTKMHYERD